MTQILNGLDAGALAAIATVRERFASTILAGDWDAHLQCDDPEEVTMPPHMPPLDAAAHRAFVLQYPKVTAFRMTALNVNGRGDLAYEHGSYDITAAGVADQGSYLAVWRQQPDGAWTVLRFMWNTDLPR